MSIMALEMSSEGYPHTGCPKGSWEPRRNFNLCLSAKGGVTGRKHTGKRGELTQESETAANTDAPHLCQGFVV